MSQATIDTRLYEAAGQLRIKSPRETPWVLRPGTYGNGHGALAIYEEAEVSPDGFGTPWCKLTVNLQDEPDDPMQHAGFDTFWVKLADFFLQETYDSFIASGLFERVDPPRIVGAGFVTEYAQLWRFARCSLIEHGPAGERYVVECTRCRAHLEAQCKDLSKPA